VGLILGEDGAFKPTEGGGVFACIEQVNSQAGLGFEELSRSYRLAMRWARLVVPRRDHKECTFAS